MPIELVPNHLHCSVNKISIVYLVTIDSFDWDELAPKLGMFSINYVEELGIPKDKVIEARTIFLGESVAMLLRRLFDMEDTGEPVKWSEIEQLCEQGGLNVQVCDLDEKSTTYCITHPEW